jgi:arsenate reductase
MSDRVFNVLFLCTGNSARSIMAESILARCGAEHFRAYSAGSMPKGQVNPLALETLERHGYPTADLRSKSWDEFDAADAPQMDFIFTVCDNAAGEVCPIWPGHPQKAHWGIEDPAAVAGTHMEQLTAFETAFRYLKNRIDLFVALPLAKLEASSLHERLDQIGRGEGATPGPEHG